MSHPERLTDTEFEDTTVKQVDRETEGWAIQRADGWTFYVPEKHGVEPKVGDAARFYGRGIGYTVRGLALNDVEVFYRTEGEERARFELEMAEQAVERRRKFEENRADHDRRIAALPEVFQRRLRKFQDTNPDFRWEHEGYELFTCEQALLIAETFAVERIPLSQGGETLISRGDLALIEKYSWYESRRPTTSYAVSTQVKPGVRTKPTYLHHLILPKGEGSDIDHVNGDGLDNRRVNLRRGSHRSNLRNRRGAATKSSTLYKGVHRDDRYKKPWEARIKTEDGQRYLGRFETADDAAKAYDTAAREAFKEDARLNFPDTPSGILSLDPSEAIKAFSDADWEDQKRIVSGLDEGHSGNTFDFSCRLANSYLTEPEWVYLDHGALTILVGCAAYGCPHPDGAS